MVQCQVSRPRGVALPPRQRSGKERRFLVRSVTVGIPCSLYFFHIELEDHSRYFQSCSQTYERWYGSEQSARLTLRESSGAIRALSKAGYGTDDPDDRWPTRIGKASRAPSMENLEAGDLELARKDLAKVNFAIIETAEIIKARQTGKQREAHLWRWICYIASALNIGTCIYNAIFLSLTSSADVIRIYLICFTFRTQQMSRVTSVSYSVRSAAEYSSASYAWGSVA